MTGSDFLLESSKPAAAAFDVVDLFSTKQVKISISKKLFWIKDGFDRERFASKTSRVVLR